MNKKSKKVPNIQRRLSRKQHADEQTQALTSSETITHYVHGPRGIHAQQQDDEWKWMIQDGLGNVRSVVDNDFAVHQSTVYDPYGNPVGLTGTQQMIYGYTGEPVDSNGLVYLRYRYYNPKTGTFISQDPYEGSMSNPMSLNRYAYVQGNPVNMTDPSGMNPAQAINSLMRNNPLAFANMMNAGVCYQGTTPTPTPIPCAMRDRNGVNVLAATAFTETDAGGVLAQDPVAVTALMMVQMNSFIASRERGWIKLGTWTQDPDDIIAPTSVPVINDIAGKVVEGYCLDSTNPLALVNSSYPSVAQDSLLQSLAGNPLARFEASIDATRADEFRADLIRQPLQYVITPLGATRAIVIGGPNVPRAWLGYQCAVGQQAVINGDPNTFTNPLSAEGNHICTPCTNVSEWWWLIPNTVTPNDRVSIGGLVGQQLGANQRYIRVSDTNLTLLLRGYGGSAYVASCI